MKISPIFPSDYLKNPPRQSRAFVAVKKNSHDVVDCKTGAVSTLDPKSAWIEHAKLNEVTI